MSRARRGALVTGAESFHHRSQTPFGLENFELDGLGDRVSTFGVRLEITH